MSDTTHPIQQIQDQHTIASVSGGEPGTHSMYAKGTEPHKDWICPISFKVMVDPVVAKDGHSYERSEISKWLQNNNTSPLDRSEIDLNLYTNIALKIMIHTWKTNNPDYEKKDKELDRQIELASLRIKPLPTAVQAPARTYISQVATLTFPGWNVVQQHLSPRNSVIPT
jgi:hypothetical protein